jgi:lipopolysaccharide transport system ATP-binding protein
VSTSAPVVVEVSHLSKRYTRDLKRSLHYGVQDIARELRPRTRPRGALRPDEFLSLDDVSLTVRRGESLAVMGANGAGKSTLLKVLHGLIKPDGGEVRIHGRVGALIELGAGFDPILTGRENIATQGLVLGFTRREIADYAERVIDFAELTDAIDTPVRYYSSGMVARLAFSVAAQMRAEVMLVDEVLAVGDLAFQRKCMAHLIGYLDGGGSVILVSHSVHQIQTICKQGLLLQHGRAVFQGDVTTAVSMHLESQRRVFAKHADAVDHSADPVQLLEINVFAADGRAPRFGEPAEVVLRYASSGRFEVRATCLICTPDGMVCIAGTYSPPYTVEPGEGVFRARIDRLTVMTGAYTVRGAIVDATTAIPLGTLGFADVPSTMIVSAPPGREINALEASGALTIVESTWSDPEPASSDEAISAAIGPGDPPALR